MKYNTSFKRFLAENKGDTNLVTQFFFLARNSATYAHYLHLMTESYAEHTALNEYYSELPNLIDSFAEAYIGQFGKLSKSMPTDVEFLEPHEFRGWVEDNRELLTDAKELQNIIDEIISFCDSIIYKLDNLK